MSDFKGKKILIFQQRGWAINVGHFLAKKLQAEGCELAALTLRRTTHNFIISQQDVNYKKILNVDEIIENPHKFIKEDDLTLEKICAELNLDSVWGLLQSNRLLVRSYGDKYFYSFSQNVSDKYIADYVKAYYSAVKNFLEEFRPDLIITAAAIYDGHAFLHLLAKKYDIPVVALTDAKVTDYYFFTYSYKNDNGEFFDRVDALNEKRVETANREKASRYIRDFRDNFFQTECAVRWEMNKKKKSFIQKIKWEISPYKQIAGWYLKKRRKNFIKNVGPTTDCRPPRIIWRDFYAQKKYLKFARNFDYYPLEKIGNCVYFPLQYQPEATIDLFAPYFNNQLDLARQIAMSLPGDFCLVVKPHPGMAGIISPSYIKKLNRTPNIKIVDYRLSGKDVLKKAKLVLSPNSTTLAEAAFFHKPAIQFGDLGTTLKLPNVQKHTDMTTLSKKIKEMLNLNLDTPEYNRRLENYVAAVYDVGFKFKYAILWRNNEGDKEFFWQIYKKEIKRILTK